MSMAEDAHLEAAYEDRYGDLYPVGSAGYWFGADDSDMEPVDDDRDMWDDVPDDDPDDSYPYGFEEVFGVDSTDEPPF